MTLEERTNSTVLLQTVEQVDFEVEKLLNDFHDLAKYPRIQKKTGKLQLP